MPITDLPHELLLEIFSYFPRYDPFHSPPLIGATDHFGNSELHRFSTVCRSWRFAVLRYIYETLPVGILPPRDADTVNYFETMLLLYKPISDSGSFQHTPLVRSLYIHLDVFENSNVLVDDLNKVIAIARNCVNLRKIIISPGVMDLSLDMLDSMDSLLSVLCAALAELPLKHVQDLEFSLFDVHGSNGYLPRDNLQSEPMPKGTTKLLEKLAPQLTRFQAEFAISSAAISTFVEKSTKSKVLRHLGWRFINNDGAKRLRAQLEKLSSLTSLDLCHAVCELNHWHKLLKKITSVVPNLESLAIGARENVSSSIDYHPRAAESVVTTLCQTFGKNLRKLDVSGNTHLGDKWWHAVLDSCPNLEILNMAHTRVLELDVWRSPDMTKAVEVGNSKPRLPRLRFLNLYSWIGFNHALLKRISRDAPNARYLWAPITTDSILRYSGEFLINTYEAPTENSDDFLRGYEDGMHEDIDTSLQVEVGFVPWQIKAILAYIDKPYSRELSDEAEELRTNDLHLRGLARKPGQDDWAGEVNWETLGLWYPFLSWGDGRRRYNLDIDLDEMWDDYDGPMDTYMSDMEWGSDEADLSDEEDFVDEEDDDDGFQTRFGDEWQTTDEEAE